MKIKVVGNKIDVHIKVPILIEYFKKELLFREKNSPSLVSRVTGGDTYHYTNEDVILTIKFQTIPNIPSVILKLDIYFWALWKLLVHILSNQKLQGVQHMVVKLPSAQED